MYMSIKRLKRGIHIQNRVINKLLMPQATIRMRKEFGFKNVNTNIIVLMIFSMKKRLMVGGS